MKLIKNKQIPRPSWMVALAVSTSLGSMAVAQTAATEDDEEDVFELSPFVVTQSENDIGYRAQNTLAGSRLNTNVADLAASISVITKAQIEDTASTDLNDIFRYEAGVEGSSTYTPGVDSFRGDGLADVNAGYAAGGSGTPQTNATANSVRGLGSPSASINFYRAINQIPLDSYNIQSVEISRGPNSMLFGTGSPAGVVNQSRSTASFSGDATSVRFVLDDRGSFRTSFSFNRPLIEDKLAIFGAAMMDNKEFERKPSYDDTERFYGSIAFKPFEKTRLNFSFEQYSNENRRPNTLTPVDFVSSWKEAGMPMYDPTNMMVTYTGSGQTVGPFIRRTGSPLIAGVRSYIESLPNYDPSLWGSTTGANARTTYRAAAGRPAIGITDSAALTNPDSVMYVPVLSYANDRPTMQIGGNDLVNWFQAHPSRPRPQFGTATNPAGTAGQTPSEADIYANSANASAYEQRWTSSADRSALGNGYRTWRYPGVTDKSIYNWERDSILGMNFAEEDAKTYNFEFEQKLREDLFFSAGWFRQDFSSFSSYTVSQLNAAALFVDTNLKLPDGSPNPYAGAVYVEDQDPDRFQNDIINDQYRAILAYTPDFTKNDGWTRWLGKHQFVGFASEERETRDFRRLRFNFVDSQEDELGQIRFLANPNNNADGTATGYRNEGGSTRRAFYLSSPNLPVSQYGMVNMTDVNFRPGTVTDDIAVYNFGTSSWQDISYTAQFKTHSASNSTKAKTSSWNIGGTSTLWDGRIIATYGIREDEVSNTGTTSGEIRDIDGNVLSAALPNNQIWVDGLFNEDLVLNRYRPWGVISEQTTTTGVVFRPFSKWDGIESRANSGNVLAEFINTFGITYNKSDTFNPPTADRRDLFGNQLEKPIGNGEDIGIQFSLFENKFFARLRQYESTNENEQVAGGTVYGRFTDNLDQQTFRNWARTIALINMGQDPRVTSTFGVGLDAAELDELEDRTAAIWGLPYTYYQDLGSTGATRSVFAKGTEFEMVYNPIPNWTIKLTGSEQETIYANVLKEYQAWSDERLPYWESARAVDFLLPQYASLAQYTTDGGTVVDLRNFMQSFGYTSQVRQNDPGGNVDVTAYYNNILVPQVRLQTDLDGQVIRNQSKYQAALTSTYKFVGDRFKGVSVGGSLRWLDKKSIGYFGAASGANGTQIDYSDVSRPVFTPAQTYVDFWASYSKPIYDEKIDMKVQLNIVNAFEDGGLQTVSVNWDGSPAGFRIVDPRQIKLTVSFDM